MYIGNMAWQDTAQILLTYLHKVSNSERVVSVWNSLPDSVDFSTLSKFRRSIMRVDFSKFLRCFWCAILFLLLYYYLSILNVMIRLPLVLV